MEGKTPSAKHFFPVPVKNLLGVCRRNDLRITRICANVILEYLGLGVYASLGGNVRNSGAVVRR